MKCMGKARSRPHERGICLTPQACALIEAAIQRKWLESGEEGRLTRAGRAAILDLSVPTAVRLLAGRRVDRNTAKTSCLRAGVEWSDCFVQCSDPPVGAGTVDEAKSPPARHTRSTAVWGTRALLLLAALAVTLLLRGEGAQGDWANEFAVQYHLGRALYQAGDYPRARATLTAARELARRNGGATEVANALRELANIDAATGSHIRARELYLRALAVKDAFNDDVGRSATLERLGDLQLRLGKEAEAGRCFRDALAISQSKEDVMGAAEALRGLGATAYQLDEWNAAEESYARSLEAVKGLGKHDFEVDIQARLALVAAARGRIDEAERVLQQTLDFWSSKNHVRWMAQTRLRLAVVAWTAGDSVTARQRLKEAKQGFETVGDRLGIAEVDNFDREHLNTLSSLNPKAVTQEVHPSKGALVLR